MFLFAGQTAIIRAMLASWEISRSACPLSAALRGALGFVFLAGALVVAYRPELRKPKTSTILSAPIVWAIPVGVSADVTAAPEVTSPVLSVARFSVPPLATVADAVDARRTHLVAVSRIGGLYGP